MLKLVGCLDVETMAGVGLIEWEVHAVPASGPSVGSVRARSSPLEFGHHLTAELSRRKGCKAVAMAAGFHGNGACVAIRAVSTCLYCIL